MAREVKISIKMDGTDKAQAEVREIKSVFDQLDDAASRDIQNIQRTLNAVDTNQLQAAIKQVSENGGLDEASRDARELQKILDQVDGEQLNEAARSIENVGNEAQQAATVYRDSAGQMHDENGKFVKTAQDAANAADNLGERIGNAAKQFDKLKNAGASVKNFGGDVQNFGQTLTVGLTAPIVAMATFGITSQANLEKAEVSFTRFIKNSKNFTGSLEDARREAQLLMQDLQAFSDTTPFESEEVIASGRTLLAAKIPRAEIQSFLKDAGDLAAAANTSITEVTQAMSRLKSGDFGEAFERLRDFGISKEDLTTQGLEFDKGGSFKGSAEQAMTAVRAIIRERFGDTMDDLSETLSGRFSTLTDKGKAFFRELFLPAFVYAKPAIDFIVAQIVIVTSYLAQISPQTKLMIVGILAGIALIGPALVVIGSLIVAIGAVVSAIGTIGGALAGVSLAPVLVIVAAVVAVLATVGVAVYALYEAWQSNFGNIQGVVSVFVSEVQAAFNDLLSTIQPAVDTVSDYVTDGFDKINQWWAENGEIINQAATKTFALVLSTVRDALDMMRAFWEDHGATITEIARAAWEIIKAVISGAASFLGNAVKLIAQIINNDWEGAWETTKNIFRDAFDALETIIIQAGKLLLNAVKLAYEIMFSTTAAVVKKASDVGSDIGKGLYDGILKWVDPIGTAGRYLGKAAADAIGIGAQVQSPSKLTIAVGEFIGEGLAIGIENKIGRASAAARQLAAETIKGLRDAATEFGALAGASPETVQRIQQTNQIKEATSGLQEIIKMRAELKTNNFKPLPTTPGGVQAELRDLKAKQKAQEDFNKSQDALVKSVEDAREAIEKENVAFAKKIVTMRQSGDLAVLNQQKENALLGVTNEFDRQRIQNNYEILRLRQEMTNDGYGDAQIEEAVAVAESVNAAALEWTRLNQIKKQGVEASKLAKDLDAQLEGLQRNGRELTEYEKTLRQIEASYKDLSAAEKQDLLNKAAQIDRQREFNKEYQRTFDFIRSGLDVLFEKGKSWGDKFKAIFSDVFGQIKKSFLDKLATALTGKITGSGSSSGGGLLGNLLGGNGIGGTPSFNPNAGGGGIGGVLNGGAGRGGLLGRAANLLGLGGLFGGVAAAAAPAGAMVTAGGLTGLSTTTAGILSGGASAGGIAGGSAAGAGAGGFGALGGLLTNPWTIAAVGAAVGGFLLWKFFRKDKTLDKLKDAANAQYAIKVSDNGTLKNLRSIGEGYFGKGQVAAKATEVVQLEESKNILRAYAERTGQSVTKFDADKFKDENWAGNQFGTKFGGFREFGGAVRAGMAYVVGEKRPELFVPSSDGVIIPSVNFAAPASAAASDSGQSQRDQLLMNMVEELTSAVESLHTKLRAMRPGDVVSVAAQENPGAFADAVESEFSTDPRRTEQWFRNTGQA